MFKLLILVGIFAILQLSQSAEVKPVEVVDKDGFKLKLVFVAVRGGEFVPGAHVFDKQILTKAKITQEAFAGYEIDDLLDEGKKRVYEVGQKLRTRYAPFLGAKDKYTNEEVALQSLNLRSLKKTALLVKKGLENQEKYKTGESTFSKDELDAPYENEKELVDDFARFLSKESCPAFTKEMEFVNNKDNYDKSVVDQVQKLLPDELKYANVHELHILYEIGVMAKKVGKAPEWFNDEFVKALEKLNELYLRKKFSTQKLQRLSGGRIVSDVKNDIDNLLAGKFKPEERKMFIFGTTSSFFSALISTFAGPNGYRRAGKKYEVEFPSYGATHVAEAYEKGGKYYFKFYYDKDGSGLTWDNEVQLQVCEGELGYCTFESWVKALKDLWLSKEEAEKECKA